MKRVEIFVYGIVQGVGFRYFVERKAKAMGIKGFVKNLEDGRVYIVAEGDDEKIEKLIQEVKKGPPLAKVDKIDIKYEEPKGDFNDFKIK